MPTGVIFLLVLSVLVLVHEFGHFMAAILLKIKVEEFAFGLPFTKPIFKTKFKGVQYSVYPLLFGGFVRMYGEDSEIKSDKATKKDRGRDFWSRGKKQRLMVIMAGVVMNILLAFGAFAVVYSRIGVPKETKNLVTVVEVADGSPAKEAGLGWGDRIVKIEGKEINNTEQFTEIIRSWGDLKVNLTVESGQTTVLFEGITQQSTTSRVVTVKPRKNPPEGQGSLGVVIADYPYIITTKCSILNAQCSINIAKQGVKSTGIWAGRVLEGLRSIGKNLAAGKVPQDMAGPVGIYQLTGIVAAEGWLPLLEMVAVLSVNLAVFNVLPIPALDGGRAFFVVLEWVSRKRISATLEQKINSWGMVFLLSLMALISLQDVWRAGIITNILSKIGL